MRACVFFVMFFPLRLTVGAGVLGASSGTCVWGLEARLLLPDASLLHERGGAEPGESFNVSTRVHMVAHIALCFTTGIQSLMHQLHIYLIAGRKGRVRYGCGFFGRFLFCYAFFVFVFLNDLHTHGLRLLLETLENVTDTYLSYKNFQNHTRC